MVKLKSYRLKDTLKKKFKKSKSKRRKPIRDIATAGVTALIGTAFVAQTAGVINRL